MYLLLNIFIFNTKDIYKGPICTALYKNCTYKLIIFHAIGGSKSIYVILPTTIAIDASKIERWEDIENKFHQRPMC